MIVAVNPSGKILNVPNLLSLFRIFLTFVGIVIFLLGPEFGDVFRGFIKITEKYSIQYTSFICFWIFVIASATDFLDGYIARKYNQITNLGKFLDSIADKILTNSFLILFACSALVDAPYLSASLVFKNNWLFILAVVIIIIRDLVVDAMRMMVAKKNVVVAANIYGKIKTFVLMIAIALLFLVNSKTMSSILMPYYTGTQFINGTPSNAHDFWLTQPLFSLIYVSCILSVISGAIYLKKNWLFITHD